MSEIDNHNNNKFPMNSHTTRVSWKKEQELKIPGRKWIVSSLGHTSLAKRRKDGIEG